MKKMNRRELIGTGIGCLSVVAIARFDNAVAGTCTDPSSESLRESLSYTDMFADPSQACEACAFFKGKDKDGSCGHCEIMNGPVSPTGHCDSWGPSEAPKKG